MPRLFSTSRSFFRELDRVNNDKACSFNILKKLDFDILFSYPKDNLNANLPINIARLAVTRVVLSALKLSIGTEKTKLSPLT